MPGVAMGEGHEFYGMTQRCEVSDRAAGLEFTVIRMGADDKDAVFGGHGLGQKFFDVNQVFPEICFAVAILKILKRDNSVIA